MGVDYGASTSLFNFQLRIRECAPPEKDKKMKEKIVAMVLEAPGRIVEREFPRPLIGQGDLLLRIELTAICGSDRDPFLSRTPERDIYPIIMGHELVGFVDEIGPQAANVYAVGVGDRVTVEPYLVCGRCRYCLTGHYSLCINRRCYGVNLSSTDPPHLWGGYSEYMFVAPGSRVHKIDPDVPAESACLSSVMGNGVRWVVTKGQVELGDTLVILGAGAQGLCTTIVAQEVGAEKIILVGRSPDESRFPLAREFGASHMINIDREDPVQEVRDITNGEMADVVVDTCGAISGLQLSVELAKPLGRCVIVGLPPENRLSAVSTATIVRKELQIVGGLGQSWNVEQAVRIINMQKYPIYKMVTDVYPLNDAQEALEFFVNKPEKCIRVALKPY